MSPQTIASLHATFKNNMFKDGNFIFTLQRKAAFM